MTAACNFISLGEKMRELSDKNGKRKKKDNSWTKKGAKFARCVECFLAKLNESWQSWFKVLTARRAMNEGAQFWKISTVITSGI